MAWLISLKLLNEFLVPIADLPYLLRKLPSDIYDPSVVGIPSGPLYDSLPLWVLELNAAIISEGVIFVKSALCANAIGPVKAAIIPIGAILGSI